MKKIKRLSLVLFIFSVLALSYPATHVFAQGGAHVSGAHLSGGQCDSNPACNTNAPNAIPCCSLEGNSGSQPQGGHQPRRHPGSPNDPPGSILLVKKLEKMSHELKECQSLTKELKSASQPAPRQAPRRCQPDRGNIRRLDEANQAIDGICLHAQESLLTVNDAKFNKSLNIHALSQSQNILRNNMDTKLQITNYSRQFTANKPDL